MAKNLRKYIDFKLTQAQDILRDKGIYVQDTPFSPKEWRSVFWRLPAILGLNVSYFFQPKIMDVKPQQGFQPASSGGTATFPLHTDVSFHPKPPKYIAMFCIEPGCEGGEHVVSDGLEAYQLLNEQQKLELASLKVNFPAPSHVSGGSYEGSIISIEKNDLKIRFNEKCMQGQTSLSLAAFYENLQKLRTVVPSVPGTVMIYDNHRFCHGRNEIGGGMNSTRWYKRSYYDPQI